MLQDYMGARSTEHKSIYLSTQSDGHEGLEVPVSKSVRNRSTGIGTVILSHFYTERGIGYTDRICALHNTRPDQRFPGRQVFQNANRPWEIGYEKGL